MAKSRRDVLFDAPIRLELWLITVRAMLRYTVKATVRATVKATVRPIHSWLPHIPGYQTLYGYINLKWK